MPWSYRLSELARAVGGAAPNVDFPFSAVSTDTRTLAPGQVFFALKGENFDGDRFVADAFAKGAAAAVCTTAHEAGPCILVPDAQQALSQFAAWHRGKCDVPVFAVTGSCGKTTTKDMVARLLGSKFEVVKTKGNLNNEIGCPLSLLQIDPDTQFAVIEMGANHKGEIARLCKMAQPTESAITIIAPAHLEGFGSIEDVAKAKSEIMEGLSESGVFYVNVDDPRCAAVGERFSGTTVRFGSEGDVVLKKVERDDTGELALTIDPIGEIRLALPSRAHATNALLAIAVGLRHGITEFEQPLQEALRNSIRFKTLAVGPLTVLDDTYNANPASVAAALESLGERRNSGKRIAALGDMLELGDDSGLYHARSGEKAAACGVDALFARGDYARDTIEAARRSGLSHAEVIEDHRAIAEAIHRIAEPGDILLVKGSRGMRMERVIEGLQELYRE